MWKDSYKYKMKQITETPGAYPFDCANAGFNR